MPSTNTSPLHIANDDADGDGVVDDPDAGKDLTYLVPTLDVGWDTPPSFNIDPGDNSGGAALSDMVPNSEPINFDGGAVRAAEGNLLAQARNGVANYEELRAKVDSVVHGTFWGPPQPDQPISGVTGPSTPTGAGGVAPSADDQNRADQQTLADIGEEFARNINPLMQKALAMQSAAFQQLGSYIAMINASGQAYAHTDRAARFPDPPGPVTS